jgi:hypothetical protein
VYTYESTVMKYLKMAVTVEMPEKPAENPAPAPAK